MFFRRVLLGICLLHYLHDFHASSCDDQEADACEDPPVFSPSRLVVKHGDPTSATCTVCKDHCHNQIHGLEISMGTKSPLNGTKMISWKVDEMTEWDISALCYYNYNSSTQCCTTLPVTVYQPPVSVSLSFVNHSGPVTADRTYTMECVAEDVAPVNNLTLTLYRGSTQLAQTKFNETEEKPVTKRFTLDISPRKEDNGAQYWCEARLDLGPGGPEHPPVVTSENITATVHYVPYREGPSHPDTIIVTKGYPLQLNCSAVGNPSPTYLWTVPSSVPDSKVGSIFTVSSTTFEDEGQYVCTVDNRIGVVNVTFNVQVQVDYIPIIIGVVVGVIALAALVCFVVVFQYYKHNRMGQYNLKDVIRFRSRHVAVPVGE